MRRTSILSSFTLWFVAIGIVVAIVQLDPSIGIFYLMFGGPLLNVLLIGCIIGGFILDCLIGPFPLVGIVVPLIGLGAFGIWYESEVGKDRAAVATIEAEIQGRNTGASFAFDPAHQALVYDDSRALLQYALPAIYVPNRTRTFGSRYFRVGIKARRDCRPTATKDNPSESLTLSENVLGPERGIFCQTRAALDPYAPLVAVDTHSLPSETIAGRKVDLAEVVATYNGNQVARRVTATTKVLTPFPIFIVGCFLIDAPPAWKCGADFFRVTMVLDTIPGAGTPQSVGELGSVLTLQPRTDAEIAALTAK